MAEGIFNHDDRHRIPESDNSQNFWTDGDMNRKDPTTFFSPGSWARMTEEFLSDEERHRIIGTADSVNSESESDEELALATGKGGTGQGQLKTKEPLLPNIVDRTTEEFHNYYEDRRRIPDSDNSESETDDEELSLTSGHGGQNSKEPLLTKRGNPWNLDKKGRVLWKREFCKDKVNLQLLDPNVRRKTQLNKMWSELDETKKFKWIKEAEVVVRKKQKDLETKKQFSIMHGPSFQRNGPLLKKNGRTVNLNNKGRLLWKTNFRADKKKMELLLPNIKSKKQLNKMWIELDESEKLEWRKKAEVKIRNREEMSKFSEEFKHEKKEEIISHDSDLETEEENVFVPDSSLPHESVLENHEQLLSLDDEEPEEFLTHDDDGDRIPDLDDYQREIDEDKLPLVTSRRGLLWNEPLLTKKGNPVNLNKKGGVLWKKEFRKDRRKMQLLDPNIKQKTQLSQMWNDLAHGKKLKWMNKVEVKLRNKQKSSQNGASSVGGTRNITKMYNEEKYMEDTEEEIISTEGEDLDLETEEEELSFVPGPSLRPEVFQNKEPLLSRTGKPIKMSNQGRLLWRNNYRGLNSHDRSKLNQMWEELDENEKLEWINKAEIQIRENPENLHFVKSFVTEKLPKIRIKLEAVLLGEDEDDFSKSKVNGEEESGSGPSLMDFPVKPPLRSKSGRLIILADKGRQLWKMHFPKEHLDKKIKRCTYLNSVWSSLSPDERSAWMTEAEFLLRSPQKKLTRIILPTPRIPWSNFLPDLSVTTAKATVFVRGDEERNQARLGYMTRRGKDKSSVTIDLPKPQEQFLFKVDNSVEPFVPSLTKKPNSLPLMETVPYDPLALGPIVGEDGVEYYAHPYEDEIKSWTPTEHQLRLPSQVEPISELAFGEPFNIIDTIEGVPDLLSQLKSSTEFAVDLEHHSVRSFMGLTCLIQISTRTQDFIVDGLALHQQLDVLNEVFTDSKIVKVLHGASNDILWLQQDFGLYVVGLFDTSVAGKYLFNGKLVSLKYLLENLVGIEVDKTHQISEWRIRPLPADMIHYARSDTHYLLSLFDIMKEMLSQDGTEQVKAVYEDSKAICLQIFRKPRSTPSPRFLEKVGKLSSRSSFAFLELFKWRDTLGRELDESGPLFILSNKLLEKLARSLPTNPNYFREILESHCNDVISPLIQAHMDTLIHIMEMALEIPLSDSDAEEDECGGGEDFESDDESQTQDEDMLKSINFRRMAIIPSLEELFSDEQNLLEKNVISGPYRNLNHYLNVQFKLLREDFIRSIKPGLKDYKERKSIRTYPGIKVHTNIQFLGLGKNEKPNQWRLQLPPKLNQLTKSSKRFLPGSFLLFTTDHFMNTHSGLISHPRDLQALLDEDNGIFTVSIRAGELPTEPWVIGQRFVTIECDAYFEPYRNVMQVLKHNTWLDKNPIGKYLLNGSVSGQGQVKLPHYLTGGQRITVESIEVDLKDPETWPSPHELGLDDAQFRAYQAALTQEIVLIQGPPGTGKTYLGLKILQTLMEEENEDLWRGKNGMGGPIIVVCFTNHALDQFGEGILDMYTPEDEPKSFRVENPRILRLGMNCSSERLSGYTTDGYDNLKVKARMQDMDIILCTTTGAAMRHSVLTKLNSKILIVEEAAEVMESHIIGCLTRSIQHLILLGDHQQLRPLTASHELSHIYHLDVSIFERLATRNNFPKFTLEIQRRMRPEIRDLITGPHIYPILKDHESVTQYPPIKGVKTSMFFLHHCYLETDTDNDSIENQSKSNPFEAQFLACLAVYLLRQGYQEENITVLAMYSSQVRLLATEIWHRRGISRKLRIETVDSFQGEENTIVLLSLVRSNQRNSIGFMRTDNRICVALSRAKHGFYIVGNMNLLVRNSSTWATINEKLLRSGLIGTTLTLTCDQHDDMSVQVGTVQQFEHILMTPCPACLNNKNSGKAGARAGRKTKWV